MKLENINAISYPLRIWVCLERDSFIDLSSKKTNFYLGGVFRDNLKALIKKN